MQTFFLAWLGLGLFVIARGESPTERYYLILAGSYAIYRIHRWVKMKMKGFRFRLPRLPSMPRIPMLAVSSRKGQSLRAKLKALDVLNLDPLTRRAAEQKIRREHH